MTKERNKEWYYALDEVRGLYTDIRGGTTKAHELVPEIRKRLTELGLDASALNPLGRHTAQRIEEELDAAAKRSYLRSSTPFVVCRIAGNPGQHSEIKASP